MLGSLFHWFYCLPIYEAWLVILTCTGLFLFMRYKFAGCRFWKPALAVLLLCWVGVLAAQTLLGRTPETNRELALMPLQSYVDVRNGADPEIYRNNLMNLFLFYPAGLLTISLWTGGWGTGKKIALIMVLFAMISTGVESIQYAFGLGVVQTDDVIHNTLGAFLGAMAGLPWRAHSAN